MPRWAQALPRVEAIHSALESARGVWGMRDAFRGAGLSRQAADSIRGFLIEDFLGGNLPNSFRTIDRVVRRASDGVAEVIHSIKSYDLTGSSFQRLSSFRSKMKQHIDVLADFVQETRGGETVQAVRGTRRVLDVAIEEGAATAGQQEVMDEMVEYAAEAGVELVFHTVK